MAQYFEDWSGSTIGQAPAGWSPMFGTGGATYTVESEADPVAPAGRRLRIVSSSLARRVLKWDAIGGDADRGTVEIKILTKGPVYSTNYPAIHGAARVSGAAASENILIGGMSRGSTNGKCLTQLQYSSGASTVYGSGYSGSPHWTEGAFYWVTFKATGTTITVSIASAADPGTVLFTFSETVTLTTIGEVGIASQASGLTVDVYAIGVGTGGDSAPTSNLTGEASASGALQGVTVTAPSASATGGTGPAVKGVSIALYDGTTPQANVSGITARWWDSATATGAPLLKTDTAGTDASGVLTIDLDAATSLSVGQSGYLSLYKAGADAQSDLHFASRLAVSDIG